MTLPKRISRFFSLQQKHYSTHTVSRYGRLSEVGPAACWDWYEIWYEIKSHWMGDVIERTILIIDHHPSSMYEYQPVVGSETHLQWKLD